MKDLQLKYLTSRMALFFILYFLLVFICIVLLFSGISSFSVALVLTGGTILFFILFSLFISLPYKKISDHIDDYYYGYSDELVPRGRTQLFSSLDRSFQKIHDDIRTEKSLKTSNKHAEYLALQNQINPHFLYNTLEGIRSDALMEGADHIAGIIESLAVYFRYTISKIDRLVTLDEELTNLNNYLAIQNYRFGDRISLREVFDQCDRSICRYLIPKLILQPFIENSIIHGLEEKVGPGLITIRFSVTDSLLLITIEDDGVGIDEDKLKSINQNLNTINSICDDELDKCRGSIAIRNVNNRIKLLFGEKFGVKIRSLKNFGTSVDIVLPLVKNKSESPEI